MALTAIAILAAPIVLATSCSKQQPQPGKAQVRGIDPFTWSRADRRARVFVAGKNGLEAFDPAISAGPAPEDAGDLPQVRAIAAKSRAGRAGYSTLGAGNQELCAIAIEGWGAAFLAIGKDGKSLTLAERRFEALTGLKVGGLWSSGSSWIISTFRDPFADPKDALPPSPGGIHLLSDAGIRPIALPPLSDLAQGDELFAFLPDPRKPGSWLAQFRNSSGPRVTSIWVSFPSLDVNAGSASLSSSSVSPGTRISREDFEAALSPRPLSAAPGNLAASLAALGEAKGSSALLRLDRESGESLWYRWGPDPASSRELHAWADSSGNLLVLSPGGKASLLVAGETKAGSLPSLLSLSLSGAPAGATFTGCALFGMGGSRIQDGMGEGPDLWIIASWEGSDANGADATGILVCPALH